MAAAPWTCQGLAEAFHLDRRNIHKYLKDMKADGLIYTCGWEEHSPGPPSRLWVVGQGEDAPMPVPPDRTEERRRMRAAPEAKAREALLKRNRRRLNKLREKSLTAYLLGA